MIDHEQFVTQKKTRMMMTTCTHPTLPTIRTHQHHPLDHTHQHLLLLQVNHTYCTIIIAIILKL